LVLFHDYNNEGELLVGEADHHLLGPMHGVPHHCRHVRMVVVPHQVTLLDALHLVVVLGHQLLAVKEHVSLMSVLGLPTQGLHQLQGFWHQTVLP